MVKMTASSKQKQKDSKVSKSVSMTYRSTVGASAEIDGF
jgi:hypothetical protein